MVRHWCEALLRFKQVGVGREQPSLLAEHADDRHVLGHHLAEALRDRDDPLGAGLGGNNLLRRPGLALHLPAHRQPATRDVDVDDLQTRGLAEP